MATLLIILAGCGPLDMIQDTLNDFLNSDESNDEDGAEEAENEDPVESEEPSEEPEEEEVAEKEEDDTNLEETADEEADDADEQVNTAVNVNFLDLPFDDRLRAQGYDILQLPNGFPFPVPYHWILVEASFDENYEGKFCYQLPISLDEMNEYFSYFDEMTHEQHGTNSNIIQTSTFSSELAYEQINGTFVYHKDEFDNMCVGFDIVYEVFGEDSSTMISDEELAEIEGFDGGSNEGAVNTGESYVRSVPANYDTVLAEYRENGLDPSYLTPLISTVEKIQNGEVQLLHLEQGYPRIFPYEWYLIDDDFDFYATTWSGTYATDFQLDRTIVKHHDMLADHHIHIKDFGFDVRQGNFGFVEFAFNDEYGTGSWHGTTYFYIQAGQQLAYVEMEFSADLID